MHAALKSYYEPEFESREVKVGGCVADIVGENGIIEIQTRRFDRLGRKLDAFLEAARVTVVYPVVPKRGLCWVDPETGEIFEKRKSPYNFVQNIENPGKLLFGERYSGAVGT